MVELLTVVSDPDRDLSRRELPGFLSLLELFLSQTYVLKCDFGVVHQHADGLGFPVEIVVE